MTALSNDRGRPVTRTASQMSCGTTLDPLTVPSAADENASARCERCGHPLHAEASIAAGIGPVCRRLRASELRREQAVA